jgi:hypothetical protein
MQLKEFRGIDWLVVAQSMRDSYAVEVQVIMNRFIHSNLFSFIDSVTKCDIIILTDGRFENKKAW